MLCVTVWRLVLTVLGVLGAASLASAGEEHFTIESIRMRVAELQPWVQGALDVELKPFEIRVVTQHEMRRIVEDELREEYARVGESPTAAQGLAALQVRTGCRAVMAKVTSDPSMLLVCPENIRWMSEQAAEYGGVLDPHFLDVLLLHELVHVAQPRTPDWAGPAARRVEALQVRRAVREGHAQYVARRIAARRNLKGAFEVLVAVLEAVPTSARDRDGQEVQAGPRGYAYTAGERFVAVVAGALGERKATQRIFTDPPRHLRAIDRPESYVDPTLDEPFGNDLEQLRDAIEGLWLQRFGEQSQGISSTVAALRDDFVWLGPVEAARAAALVRGGFLVVRSTYQDTHVRVLFCEDAGKARELYDTLARLLQRRDERFGNEAIRIEDATYSDGGYALWEKSLAFSKRIDTGTTMDCVGMIGVRENLVLECTLEGPEASPFLLHRIVWEVTSLLDGLEEPGSRRSKLGEEAQTAVGNALHVADPRIRWRDVQHVACMTISDAHKREALLPCLEDKDAHVRAAAVRLLLRAGWSEVATEERIAALVRDPDPEIAALAIANLSRWKALGEQARHRTALESLRSDGVEVLLATLEWISEEKLASEVHVDRYIALGRHPDARVRAAALKMLPRSCIGGGSLPDPRLRDIVLAALRSEANCRAQAAKLLSRLSRDWWDDAMVEALLDGLKEDRSLLAYLTWSAMEAAPPALVSAHAASFEEPVATVLRGLGAMLALRVLQVHPSLLPPHRATVADLVRHGSDGTRVAAVLALHAAGERDDFLMDALLAALEEPMGYRLADALRDWEPDRIPDSAVPVLIEALHRGDGDLLRPRAAQALAHIGARAEAALPVLDRLAREKDARSEFAEAAGTIRAAQKAR